MVQDHGLVRVGTMQVQAIMPPSTAKVLRATSEFPGSVRFKIPSPWYPNTVGTLPAFRKDPLYMRKHGAICPSGVFPGFRSTFYVKIGHCPFKHDVRAEIITELISERAGPVIFKTF